MNKTIEILDKEQAQILLSEKVRNNRWLEKTFEIRILQYIKEDKPWNFIRIYIANTIEDLKALYYPVETIRDYEEIEDLVLYIIDELNG
jgi:hypothetical protein